MGRILYLTGLCLWFGLGTIYAQGELDSEEEEVKTLLGGYNEIKGFGALDLKLTQLASKEALAVGAYGGVIVNKHVMLGLGGYGFATNVELERSDNERANLEGGYGGLMLGFIVAPREVIHLTIPLFIGAGSFHTFNHEFDFNNFPAEVAMESSSFAVVEPGLQLEINISKHVRLGLGGSYRLIQGSNIRDLKDKDLSDFAGNMTIKIGNF